MPTSRASSRTGWSSTSSRTRASRSGSRPSCPGPTVAPRRPVQLDFSYKDFGDTPAATGYETLLYDCMIGDPTLFHRADMVEAAWQIADPDPRRVARAARRATSRTIRPARGAPRPRTSSFGRTGGAGTSGVSRRCRRPSGARAPGDPMILAGDVGGTNTRLAWFDVVRGALVPGRPGPFPASSTRASTPILTEFLREAPGKPEHVCIGVAGPVRDGRVDAVNLRLGRRRPRAGRAARSTRGAARQRPRGERLGPRRAARAPISRCSSREYPSRPATRR